MKSQFILATNKHGEYCIPVAASHRPAAQHVIKGEVWEDETIEFMIKHARAADIITAGVFFGDALPALARATTGTVWGFEPNPENFRCAAITVLLNDLRNVQLTNAALGEMEATSMHLMIRDQSGRSLGGLSHVIDKSSDSTVPIQMVTVDRIVPATAEVSIVHLDLEGFEEFALFGAKKIIETKRPLLILESVPTANSMAGCFLASLGYRPTRVLSSVNTLLECQ